MSEHPTTQGSQDEAPEPEHQQPSTAPYDPEQDPDADPEMMTSQHPAQRGENERDPAEGPDDESATDG
jgi:hypothetical protein